MGLVERNAQWLTTGKAAKLCSVKPDTVLKWIKKGRLTASRTAGGHYRVQREDVERLIPMPSPVAVPRPGPAEVPAHPLRCWEYLSEHDEVREECTRCVVYRVRAALCFQVAGLGCEIGHVRQFCQTTCQECVYYRRVVGLPTNVLVISKDESLIRRLGSEPQESLAMRFARNAYEASAVICSFRPAFAVVDEELAAEGTLVECLTGDPRVPWLRIILAVGHGRRRQELKKEITGVIEKPFGAQRIAAVVESFPVEELALTADG